MVSNTELETLVMDRTDPDRLAALLYSIADGVWFTQQWTGPQDDCRQQAVLRCWCCLDRWDRTRGTAFAFFTGVCFREMKGLHRNQQIWDRNIVRAACIV